MSAPKGFQKKAQAVFVSWDRIGASVTGRLVSFAQGQKRGLSLALLVAEGGQQFKCTVPARLKDALTDVPIGTLVHIEYIGIERILAEDGGEPRELKQFEVYTKAD